MLEYVWILLPLAANLAVACVFLVTLRSGNTPLVTVIASIEQGAPLPERLARYTRRLTLAWGTVLILLGLASVLISRTVAWNRALVIVGDSVAILMFYMLEYAWRILFFPERRFASPWKLWQLIRQQGGLYRLYRRCLA